MKRLILLFLLFSESFLLNAQISFYREELEFGLDSAFFSVKGNYFFRNEANREIRPVIYFPVGTAAVEKSIDTLIAFDVADPEHPFTVLVQDSVAHFEMKLPPDSRKQVVIYYRQRHDGHRARYILTSTQTWKRPLEYASYRLIAPKEIVISRFSLGPPKVSDFGTMQIYSWEKKNFMPAEDFRLIFSIKKTDR
jgi:hypothetical protein